MPSPAELEGKTIGCGAKHNTALMYGEAHAIYSNVPNRATRDMRIGRCVNSPLKKLSVFRRQTADGFFKLCGEFALIFVAHALGDLGNAQPRFAQKL